MATNLINRFGKAKKIISSRSKKLSRYAPKTTTPIETDQLATYKGNTPQTPSLSKNQLTNITFPNHALNIENTNSQLNQSILDIMQVIVFGYAVFQNTQHFNQWIACPNKDLNYQIPFLLLQDAQGRLEVRNLIGSFENKLPS